MEEDSDAKASDGCRVVSQSDGRGGGEAEDRVKGPWSPEEDAVLSRLVAKFGARNWSLIARGIPGRSGKSCRLRWCNQLDPSVKHKPFTGIVSLNTTNLWIAWLLDLSVVSPYRVVFSMGGVCNLAVVRTAAGVVIGYNNRHSFPVGSMRSLNDLHLGGLDCFPSFHRLNCRL
ncbi:hypothetical protein ACLOJK_012526 [Asimina triloba]